MELTTVVNYVTGDVLSAASAGVIVHSVNCQGVWGAGVAAQLRKRYPGAFDDYLLMVQAHVDVPDSLRGKLRIYKDDWGTKIASLFTSKNYGMMVDHPTSIIQATHRAIAALMFISPRGTSFHSPRINAGLFKVPWERTEAVINGILEVYPENSWTVWSL